MSIFDNGRSNNDIQEFHVVGFDFGDLDRINQHVACQEIV